RRRGNKAAAHLQGKLPRQCSQPDIPSRITHHASRPHNASPFPQPSASVSLRRMAFNSFRDFLKQLESAGELRRISVPVATELELTEMADREMKKPHGGKALLVEKPTINGQPSP